MLRIKIQLFLIVLGVLANLLYPSRGYINLSKKLPNSKLNLYHVARLHCQVRQQLANNSHPHKDNVLTTKLIQISCKKKKKKLKRYKKQRQQKRPRGRAADSQRLCKVNWISTTFAESFACCKLTHQLQQSSAQLHATCNLQQHTYLQGICTLDVIAICPRLHTT